MSFFGSRIGVVAPSGIFNPDRLEQGIQHLESWGYQIQKAPNLYAKHLSMAGTEAQRIEDFIWACNNPNIDFIWYARGGYGTIQLLPALRNAITKPILGFSDATALGGYCSNLGNSYFYHAPVLHSLADLCDNTSQQHLKHFLSTGVLPRFPLSTLKTGQGSTPVSGPLVGGNLCVITTAIGTPYQLKTQGCILMLEDIGEPAYKIHRMLTQLTLSGMLSEVKAIVLGCFTDCSSPQPYRIQDFILDALETLDIPIYEGARFGHGTKNDIWNAGRVYTIKESELYVE